MAVTFTHTFRLAFRFSSVNVVQTLIGWINVLLPWGFADMLSQPAAK